MGNAKRLSLDPFMQVEPCFSASLELSHLVALSCLIAVRSLGQDQVEGT